MIPQPDLDEETSENDVRYGIAGCRERLRNRRATLRTHQSPLDVSNGDPDGTATRFESYAEILAMSMSQSSMSRLVECLLEPADVNQSIALSEEQEEAAIT
jgi:hypothetical protein